jgi:hypothetical protein
MHAAIRAAIRGSAAATGQIGAAKVRLGVGARHRRGRRPLEERLDLKHAGAPAQLSGGARDAAPRGRRTQSSRAGLLYVELGLGGDKGGDRRLPRTW